MREETQVADDPAVEEAGQATSVEPVQNDWRSEIPEEIRSHKSLETIQDIPSLAKSFVNAQSMIGADKVALPGKHATDDDWNIVYDRLGRPAEAKDYNLAASIPEGQVTNTEMLDWFSNTAHKAGLSPRQATLILNEFNEQTNNQLNTDQINVQAELEKTTNELKKEYGPAFEDRMTVGNGVLEQFGDKGIAEIQLADGRRLGDHPEVIKMIVNVGEFITKKVGEDSLEGVKTSGAIGPEEINVKLKEMTDPGTPYWDAKHPQHSFYVDEAMKYREMLNG